MMMKSLVILLMLGSLLANKHEYKGRKVNAFLFHETACLEGMTGLARSRIYKTNYYRKHIFCAESQCSTLNVLESVMIVLFCSDDRLHAKNMLN